SSRPAPANGARPSRSPTPTLGSVSGASWSRSPGALAVERILDAAFCEFGLPAAIRSDNGRARSSALNLFRREYNEERPHGAYLGLRRRIRQLQLSCITPVRTG